MDSKANLRVGVVLFFIITVSLFYIFDGQQYISLAKFQDSKSQLIANYQANRLLTIAAFAGIYSLVTAISLPVATILTLAGGAIFGWQLATIIIVVAASVGSLVPFLAGRFVLQNWIHRKFEKVIKKLNRGIAKDGWLYLFAARLSLVVPFYALNFASGATSMTIATYFSATLLGIIPGVIIYSFAGTQLGNTTQLTDAINPGTVLALVGISILPLAGRYLQNKYKLRSQDTTRG